MPPDGDWSAMWDLPQLNQRLEAREAWVRANRDRLAPIMRKGPQYVEQATIRVGEATALQWQIKGSPDYYPRNRDGAMGAYRYEVYTHALGAITELGFFVNIYYPIDIRHPQTEAGEPNSPYYPGWDRAVLGKTPGTAFANQDQALRTAHRWCDEHYQQDLCPQLLEARDTYLRETREALSDHVTALEEELAEVAQAGKQHRAWLDATYPDLEKTEGQEPASYWVQREYLLALRKAYNTLRQDLTSARNSLSRIDELITRGGERHAPAPTDDHD